MKKRLFLRGMNRAKKLYYSYMPQFLSKKNVKCPSCGWSGKEFLSSGLIQPIKNALCPKCSSLERHRLCYLYLKKKLNSPQYLNKKLEVLHIAPEESLASLFKSFKNITYLSADIDLKKAMVKEDITNLSFKDNSFDIIFCVHVLEHIENDRQAMKELYRILKPDGFAILQVPISNIENTFEDFTVKSQEEREKVFGQFNHVRIYGKDYEKRLVESGFKVKIDRFADELDENAIKKFALSKEDIYFCTKQ